MKNSETTRRRTLVGGRFTRPSVMAVVGLLTIVLGPGGVLGGLTGAPVVLAHTELDTSSPANGDVVVTAVTEITLTFTEPVEPVADGFELFLPSTEVVTVEPDTLDDLTFVITLDPPVYSGDVGVRYEVISADGHPVAGSFAFVVDAPAPATTQPATTQPASTAPASPTSAPTTVTVASVAATVAATVAPSPETVAATPGTAGTTPTASSGPTAPSTTVAAEDASSSGVGSGTLVAALLAGVVVVGGVVTLIARRKRNEVPPRSG